jgi:hypothetical protein
MKFSQNVRYLSQEQLGMVVHMIQNNCPAAYKEFEKDKCQIVVDNLDKDTFNKLSDQIERWTNNPGDVVQKKMKV